MSMIMDLGPDDVGYVCMPLFHSNAVQVGWAPSLVTPCAVGLGPPVLGVAAGCPTSAATGRRTSTTRASRSRTCSRSPSAPTTPTTRCASRSATRARPRSSQSFARRFGARGDRRVRRDRRRRRGEPRGRHAGRRARARARPRPGRRRRRQREAARRARRPTAACCNAEECVGEIVNTQGVGPFEGYYNNDDATAKTTRIGWYWSGDLGYKDDARLPLLRGPQRRLDPGRRRELSRRPDRGDAAQGAGRRARRGLRRARRPGRRPGDGRPRARRRRRRSTRPRSRAGSTRRMRSARSGGRATCASCTTRRRPAPTRS